METTVQVPKAFSVRDENEFYAFEHLLSRMNPQLRVSQVTTGVHVHGGCTVFWGLVHLGSRKLTKEDVVSALTEAGFDMKRNRPLPDLAGVVGDKSH